MDYRNALNRLLGLIDHERTVSTGRKRVRYDLRRMEAMLRRLGDPHLSTPTIHIAGTKGKGSTAAMCASVLSKQGYHTGLFSSPHMHTFRERISLDGVPVSEDEFANLVERVWSDLEWVSGIEGYGEVTMFEALTAMAVSHFEESADFQVMEVGLGGRLDTTNLVLPPSLKVCAITSLSLDHTSVLGDTIESIATEKAGIIKLQVPVVTSPQTAEAMAVIESACENKGAELVKVGEHITWSKGCSRLEGQSLDVRGTLGEYKLWVPLLGDFQLANVATAVGVLEVLKRQGFDISDSALEDGFRQVSWPCRMEVLRQSPLVVCDGAHNPYSASVLRDTLPSYLSYQRVKLIAGVSRDKNLEGIVGELAPLSPYVIVTRSRHPRAATTEAVAEVFLSHGITAAQVEGVDNAVTLALDEAREGDLILATGSLFVAAEAREAIRGIEPELYPELRQGRSPSPR